VDTAALPRAAAAALVTGRVTRTAGTDFGLTTTWSGFDARLACARLPTGRGDSARRTTFGAPAAAIIPASPIVADVARPPASTRAPDAAWCFLRFGVALGRGVGRMSSLA
jgi:hypothetical protein